MRILLVVCCIMLVVLMFAGCVSVYDEIAKPVYKGVKAVVIESNLSDGVKAKLKKIDNRAVKYDALRTDIKETAKIIKDGVLDGL